MAQVTITKMVEGLNSVIIRVDLLSDGSGELVNLPIFSPSDLNPPRRNIKQAMRIMQIWYGLVWFDVVLGFGTLQPTAVWTIARDCGSHTDFRSFGGLNDDALTPPIDEDGRLWISTNGFANIGSRGTLVLDIRKSSI